MKPRLVLAVIGIPVAAWALYQYTEFRGCGARSCSPAEDQPRIRLASGGEVQVLSTHANEGRDLVINYLTRHRREDVRALCAEAREVWEEARKKLDTRRMERAVLSPTTPESEFLGMKYVVVPLYTCCVSTHVTVEKNSGGIWVFPQCPGS